MPINFPEEFHADAYKQFNQDLKSLNDMELRAHFDIHGRNEGRQANQISNRKAFIECIPSGSKILEIGPFHRPITSGANIDYADYLSREALIKRAEQLNVPQESYKNIPEIKFVLGGMELKDIRNDYDVVVSSHCIEHQPDLIEHLLQVQMLISKKRGFYFLLIPDKRYCYDALISESIISDVLDAHFDSRKNHSLKNVISFYALHTHNDPKKHWADKGRINAFPTPSTERIKLALDHWQSAQGAYIDVHAWQFTPNSFAKIIKLLNDLKLIDLVVDKIYSTRRDTCEFWAILKYDVK